MRPELLVRLAVVGIVAVSPCAVRIQVDKLFSPERFTTGPVCIQSIWTAAKE